MATAKPTEEQIDDYMASAYLAHGEGGYLTVRLLKMAEEAKAVAHYGAGEILERAAREMAAWEIENA